MDVAALDLPKINVGREVLSNVDEALNKEWLITNGLGGYASSTVLGINTRKYHGLLVAALNPPINRWMLLTKLDEELNIANTTYPLATNQYQYVTYPNGYQFLSSFTLDPLPKFTYDLQDVEVQKTVFMPYLKNATIVLYEVNNGSQEGVIFNVSPLVNSRHIYDTTKKDNLQWQFTKSCYMDGIVVSPSDSLSSLILSAGNTGSFVDQSWWVKNVYFKVDASRGETCTDDYYRPGYFEFSVYPKETKKFFVIAAAGKTEKESSRLFSGFGRTVKDVESRMFEEYERRQVLLNKFQNRNSGLTMENWLKWLVWAADSFVVQRDSTQNKSVIAGYTWFDDWGRDALISLSGLTLVTGRFEDAKQILLTFDRNCSDGIVPNRFSDKAGDIPLYNTVDATLWFFNAVLGYLKYTGDFEFVKENLWKTLTEIVDHHIKGTIFGIHMDKDGLISHGPQLTWMDAVTTEKFVTPRSGKAVEIQALWYNTLKIMQLLAERFNQTEKAEEYKTLAQRAKASFVEKFWNPDLGCLDDVISVDGSDSSLRPNQLIAVSLDFPVIDLEHATQLVDVVWKRLWGKYGLKTLPETDPRYSGTYIGDWSHRDGAYHNGTVWAWLLGPFVTAFLKTKNYEESWRSYAYNTFLKPLFNDQLTQAGLGTLSEIFDGNEPHNARGCISQAWSVAEPLRAYVEDVSLSRPVFEKDVLKTVIL